jgi:hypothetical protein
VSASSNITRGFDISTDGQAKSLVSSFAWRALSRLLLLLARAATINRARPVRRRKKNSKLKRGGIVVRATERGRACHAAEPGKQLAVAWRPCRWAASHSLSAAAAAAGGGRRGSTGASPGWSSASGPGRSRTWTPGGSSSRSGSGPRRSWRTRARLASGRRGPGRPLPRPRRRRPSPNPASAPPLRRKGGIEFTRARIHLLLLDYCTPPEFGLIFLLISLF